MDLSYTYESCCAPTPCCESEKKEPRKEYPTLYIRKNKGEECPEIKPDKDGMCEAVIKFRVLGYRNPTDGDKTLELEVHSLDKVGADYSEKGIEEVFSEMSGKDED